MSNSKHHFLYKIENKVNGKLYIGITKNPRLRWWQHRFHRHPDTISIVKLAMDKYGVSNFTFSILCVGSADYIAELEGKAILAFGTIENGYNIRPCHEGFRFEVKRRSDDKPAYVSGFWFPNKRTAVKSLGMSPSTFVARRKSGTLGLVDCNRVLVKSGTPVYVGGMWFPCISIAKDALGVALPTLRKRIREGSVEAAYIEKTYKRGEESPLYGKKGAACINSKPIIVEGVYYSSTAEAADRTRFSSSTIYRRLKSGDPNFSYAT